MEAGALDAENIMRNTKGVLQVCTFIAFSHPENLEKPNITSILSQGLEALREEHVSLKNNLANSG